MKKYLVLFLLFSLIFTFFSGQVFSADAIPAPDFKLLDLNNKEVTLSSYKGKQPVIMLFWTTWCPYCRAELKVMNQMSEELKKDNVAFLAMNVGESSSKVSQFIKSSNFNFQVILDQEGSVSRSYGIFGVPTYVIVDDKGIIRGQENYFPKEEYKKIISN